MSSVQIEQKIYEMPPREGISIAHFLTVADIERSAHAMFLYRTSSLCNACGSVAVRTCIGWYTECSPLRNSINPASELREVSIW